MAKKPLKQVWNVKAEPVMVMLERLEKDIRGKAGEDALRAGVKVAQDKMRPFFDEGSEHNETGATQRAFIENVEIVNLVGADLGMYALVGYRRYDRPNGGTGYVSSYFERGTPRQAAEKRVPKYSFMSKIARDKSVINAMVESINETVRKYGGR